MTTITLPPEVIQDVLKFVPYENATELVQTSKSWVELLQVQLKDQQIAIKAEIRRLESTDLGKEYREFNSTYKQFVEDEIHITEEFKTNVKFTFGISKQKAVIKSFNKRHFPIQMGKKAARYQYRANAIKRQPIIDKIESLESKLDQCRKPEAERLVDLDGFLLTYRMCYGIAMVVTALFGITPITLIIFGWFIPFLYYCILSLVSGIGLVYVLPLLLDTFDEFGSVYSMLKRKQKIH